MPGTRQQPDQLNTWLIRFTAFCNNIAMYLNRFI